MLVLQLFCDDNDELVLIKNNYSASDILLDIGEDNRKK